MAPGDSLRQKNKGQNRPKDTLRESAPRCPSKGINPGSQDRISAASQGGGVALSSVPAHNRYAPHVSLRAEIACKDKVGRIVCPGDVGGDILQASWDT